MENRDSNLLILVLSAMIALCALLMAAGCKTTELPVPYEGQLKVCVDAERCRYQNQFKDVATEDCTPYAQECRSQTRYIFCNDKLKRWASDSEQNCWDKLNSK